LDLPQIVRAPLLRPLAIIAQHLRLPCEARHEAHMIHG
jgi:hypothetical protein